MCSEYSISSIAVCLAVVLSAVSCSVSRKTVRLRRAAPEAYLSLPDERDIVPDTLVLPKADTLEIVDFEGHNVMIMNAVQDEDGEMVAHDVLQAAVVTARFRNVAERHGKVDLEFQVTVPRVMLESEWQTRFYPDMYILGDSTRLDMIMLTGSAYRNAQMRGYQRYNKFLASIVSDTTRYINVGLLEKWLSRNLPQVYSYKTDTRFVSEEEFSSCFGVTERQAVKHYTNHIALFLNNRRKSKIGAMYRRYVKAPYIESGVRLDTVFVNVDGDFVYNYIQTIETRPKLRKVDIVLSGEVYEQEMLQYTVPRSEPLTFYISSLSAFTDNTERYMTKVVERRAEANAACFIEFGKSRSDIRAELGDNAKEIARIKGNLRDILQNEKYDLDSITVSSYASPEGTLVFNDEISRRRAVSAADYFSAFARHIRDSLRREAGFHIDFESGSEGGMVSAYEGQDIRFVTRTGGENWERLDRLVEKDTVLTDVDRKKYFSHAEIRNLDMREACMKADPSYVYLRDVLYPNLRSVEFNFYLHRKGMVKDTVHTTELDTVYMDGVQAIRDRDYERACIILAPYADYNAAVAYLANDRNMSALQILEPMERTGRVNYLLAVIYSRLGDERQAVQCYIHACTQDRSYVSRGNLDPEISVLIKKYDLNKEDDDDEFLY